jgi:hypothetical protein
MHKKNEIVACVQDVRAVMGPRCQEEERYLERMEPFVELKCPCKCAYLIDPGFCVTHQGHDK